MAFKCERLQEINLETRSLHYYLDENDYCTYIGEYTRGEDYTFGDFNQLIYNLKKSPSKRANPMEYRHKVRAIQEVGHCFRCLFSEDHLNGVLTLVPIPPSKSKGHPEYDDRMEQILDVMTDGLASPDVKSIIETIEDKEATHNSGSKPTPDELIQNYRISCEPGYQPREHVLLFDDMITTGSHFKACKKILQNTFPGIGVYGVFITRRVMPEISFESFI